MREEDSEEEI